MYAIRPALLLLPALLFPALLSAQSAPPAAAGDALSARYLSDVRDAAQKIRELDSLAVAGEQHEGLKLQAIRLYQMAISLAPYVDRPRTDVAMMYARFSGQVFQAGAAELGIRYQKIALAIQRRAQPAPDHRTYNILGTVGSYCMARGQYDSAQAYYRQALEEARRIGKPLWIASAWNNLGMLYTAKKEQAAAVEAFGQAMAALAPATGPDTALRVAVTDNRARLALDEKQYATARMLLEGNVALGIRNADTPRLLNSLLGLMEVAAAQGEARPALAAQCEALFSTPGNRLSLDDTLNYLRVQARYCEATGQVREALRAGNRLATLEAVRDARRNQYLNAIFAALTESWLYQYNLEIDHYQSDLVQTQRRAGLRAIIICLLLAVAVLSLILLRKNYRARHQRQEQETVAQRLRAELAENTALLRKMEEERARRELDLRNKDLANLGLYLGKIKGLYESLTEQIAAIKGMPPEEQGRELRRITNELNVQLQAQDKLSVVQEGVREASSDWNARIIQRYPNLTKTELELCAFIRLNLSNKDIAALKNISQDSVKKARHRLRQKLGLGQEEDLYRIIAAL